MDVCSRHVGEIVRNQSFLADLIFFNGEDKRYKTKLTQHWIPLFMVNTC